MFQLFRRRQNPGLIWLDEPAAMRRVAELLRGADITAEQAENLRKFAVDGYFITHIDLSPEGAARLDGDVERLWRDKPSNVTFAYDSPPLRLSAADAATQRRPRYRIHDLHVASDDALRLILDPSLHRYASLILGETAIATQSLYFEYGSQQALHRDSTVVPTPAFGRLVAAWIALEDIRDDSGPLAYVPRSQRFPFFELRPGEYLYDPSRHTPADVQAAVAFYDEQLRKSKLPTHTFLAKRGDVLVWHSALMHGGAMPADPARTRKSLVVHYSALRQQTSRMAAVSEVVDGAPGESVFETTEVIERAGAFTFGNALEGKFLYRR